MHLETLLDEPEFNLPAVNTSGDPFVLFAEQRIELYIRLLTASFSDLFTNSPPKILDFREFMETVTEFGRGLLSVIRVANSMNPHLAYPQFKVLMDKMGFLVSGYPASLFFLEPMQCFFRCKHFPGDLKAQDWFFHTGFHLRSVVTPTRFTPAGLPALYLTNALAVGYEELRAAEPDGFQAVKLKTKSNVRRSLLDLDYTRPLSALRATNQEEYDLQLQFKGLLYPLLLCCFTQRNGGGAAPPEYIVPQYLLRWVMESPFYSGIKFPSTRTRSAHFQGNFYNLVIPPIEVLDTGYCPKLKNMFLISDVCGFTEHAAAIDGYYTDNFAPLTRVNPEVESIDWQSRLEIYDTSDLGRMEFYLKNQPVVPIPF